MATITLINGTDNIKDSRSVINNNFTNLNNELGNKSDLNHNHDDLYYTEGEIDTALGLKQNTLTAGTGITIDNTNPLNPVINSSGGGGGSTTWGSITGTLSSQTDLQTELDGKVATTGNETISGVKTFSDVIIGKSGIQISPYSDNPTIIFPLGAEGEINMGGHNDLNRFFILNTNGWGIFEILSDKFTLNKDTYITGNLTATNISGTNTGDNATNTQYSGLATSKQDTLVSGTNIKTVNGTSLLGSGNVIISGGSGATKRILTVGGAIRATGVNVGPDLTIDGTYTISQINMWYGTAGNGTLTVDINKNGTTLFATTKPSITGTNKYSINTGTLTTTSLTSGDSITIDIDAVPGTPGVDLYVEIIYS